MLYTVDSLYFSFNYNIVNPKGCGFHSRVWNIDSVYAKNMQIISNMHNLIN